MLCNENVQAKEFGEYRIMMRKRTLEQFHETLGNLYGVYLISSSGVPSILKLYRYPGMSELGIYALNDDEA
jgi:hypothetical protein